MSGSEGIHAGLPLWIVLLPMVMAPFVYVVTMRAHRWGGYLSVFTGLLTVGLEMVLLAYVVHDTVEVIIGVMGQGLCLRADAFGLGIALFAAAGWSLAMVFSMDYLGHGRRLPRYWAFMLFTMGATLGVFLAGDFFTLFVFFEIMTFSSYALVVHEETQEAMGAGKTFLYMGVIGGLALLFAVMILAYLEAPVLHHSLSQKVLSSGYFPVLTLLSLIGFGMKAGMVPLHIWLPKAHPVAPAPASAVLSGVLIKAGAYGIVRMFLVVLRPEVGNQAVLLQNGLLLLGLGIATMLSGGFMALPQTDAKRLLAYSSISQMGYILTGAGAAALLGQEGALGFGGAFYHMMNHVVFKGAAFMAVGYVYLVTRHLDMTAISGLWREMPIAAFTFLVCFGAITGLPGFSGFGSKTLIHHALVEAYHYHNLPLLYWAEKAFFVGSCLTVVYFLRLGGIFFGKKRHPHCEIKPYYLAHASLLVLSALVLVIGFFPSYLLETAVLPAAGSLGFSVQGLDHGIRFFTWPNVRDVLEPLSMGILLYLVGSRVGLFRMRLPDVLSVEGLVYKPLVRFAWLISAGTGRIFEKGVGEFYDSLLHGVESLTVGFSRCAIRVDQGYYSLSKALRGFIKGVGEAEGEVNASYSLISRAALDMVHKTGILDQKLNEGYIETSDVAMDVVRGTGSLDRVLDSAYMETGDRLRSAVENLDEEPGVKGAPAGRVWAPWNLDFGSLLFALTLGALVMFLVLAVKFW